MLPKLQLLDDPEDDPDNWVTELEGLRTDMDAVNISRDMSDTDFTIHILGNWQSSSGIYEVSIESLEERMEDQTNPVTLEDVHARLNATYLCEN